MSPCSPPGERSAQLSHFGAFAGSRRRVRTDASAVTREGMLDLNRVLAFAVHQPAVPNEVRVNFGVFAGRHVTAAEIEDLAQALVPDFGQVTIVAEERHELSGQSAMS